uniref:ShKT domain-containing protein n=1 Tax=Haemonchus contortus TaxID=6289 RepID=A0A7I4XX28_HAECO
MEAAQGQGQGQGQGPVQGVKRETGNSTTGGATIEDPGTEGCEWEEVPLKDLRAAMKQHYQPKKLVLAERFGLMSKTQKQGLIRTLNTLRWDFNVEKSCKDLAGQEYCSSRQQQGLCEKKPFRPLVEKFCAKTCNLCTTA